MVDGDDTCPAEAAPEMVSCRSTNTAGRYGGGGPACPPPITPRTNARSTTLATTSCGCARPPLRRPGSQGHHDRLPRVQAADFVKTYPVLSRGFEIETEMTIHALHRNMQVENVIIDYRDRPAGSESKLNTYSDGFRVLRTIARLYKNYRPFGFFSTLAAVLALSACAFWPLFWANTSPPALCRASLR